MTRITIFCTCIVTLGTAAHAAEFYTLPVGQGLIDGISDNGVASGSSGFASQYFMWTADSGSMQIGGVTPGGGVGGQGKISDDGLFISGTTFNGAEGYHEMSMYDVMAGTWSGVGGLGAISGTETSGGWAISGDGLTVGGLGWISAGGAHGITWNSRDGIIDIGSTVPDRSTRINGLNVDGTVAVGWQDSATGFRQGAVWVDGVQELISEPGGALSSEAFDVSGDGQWVTGIDIAGLIGVASTYRYNTVTDTYEAIPNLAVGGQSRMAGAGITDDGATIVGGTWGLGPATLGTGIIWREGIGTTTLNTYFDELGVEFPAGFTFAFGSAISSDGQWIAGWGNVGGPGNTQSWVVHLGCSVAADLDGDCIVGPADLAMLLGAWGPCGKPEDCPQDLDGDGTVGAADLAILLGSWG